MHHTIPVNLFKMFCLTRKRLLYLKKEQHTNNYVSLSICFGVSALIYIKYFICDKWVWNDKILDIFLTLGHIRKVEHLKSSTAPSTYLSVWYPVDWPMSFMLILPMILKSSHKIKHWPLLIHNCCMLHYILTSY